MGAQMDIDESREDRPVPRHLFKEQRSGVHTPIAPVPKERNSQAPVQPSALSNQTSPPQLRSDERSSLHPSAAGSTSGLVGNGYPSSREARSPVPPVHFLRDSPGPEPSPFRRSPSSTPPKAAATSSFDSSGTFFPTTGQPSSMEASSSRAPQQNPWHTLAVMSGAPTPAHELPSSSMRSSVLGDPFEQLNLGSTWSHRNLSEGSAEPSGNGHGPRAVPEHAGQPGAPSGPVSAGGLGNMSSYDRRTSFPGLRLPPPLGRRPSRPSVSSSNSSSHNVASSPLLSSSSTSSAIKPLAIDALEKLINDGTHVLVLDLRPPSAFDASHIHGAHSISVPSTLLRRPAFALPKLAQMLSPSAQEAVMKWPEKSDLVIVDQDSHNVTDSNLIQPLAAKFVKAGFSGKVWFVQGGHAAVAGSQSSALATSDRTGDGGDKENVVSPSAENRVPSLGLGRLSRLAFTQGSTTAPFLKLPATTAAKVHTNPFDIDKTMVAQATAGGRQRMGSGETQNRLQPANPFFDNIRQNLELSHGGITERIPLALSPEIAQRADELPDFLRDLVQMPEKDSMDLLADQFYRIELGEQKRLQTVMRTLSVSDGCNPDATTTARNADEVEQFMARDCDQNYLPFSITAGVERGTKNRYKNIWPYDFSRVRLGTPAEDESDYINASFVQPRGTGRRYIATQGPLDATYRDFWTLVWEQHVHVIVMLTKQFEGGLLKCGNYWSEQTYGHLRLQLMSETGGKDVVDQACVSGFDFGSHVPEKTTAQTGNIKRVFRLWHKDEGPRTITQIQCTSWPDFDVPDSPEVLLNLKKDVDGAVGEMCTGIGDDPCKQPPILVHCSAGVGRTGSYILVDAVAEGLRRELLEHDPTRRVSSRGNYVSESGKSVSFADLSSSSGDESDEPLKQPSGVRMDIDKPNKNGHPGVDESGGDFSSLFVPSEASSSNKSSPNSENPEPVTQSHRPHRKPTPISRMKEPILSVLKGMRVQRMSLVQSLRQYLFVHRAIICYYLSCLDDPEVKRKRMEKEAQRNRESLEKAMSGFPSSNTTTAQNEPVSTDSGSASSSASASASASARGSSSTGSGPTASNSSSCGGLSRSLGGLTTSTAATSLPATDDESTFKRKPSATDLAEADARLRSTLRANREFESDSSSGLSKRPSFKKRRGSGGERVPVRSDRNSPAGGRKASPGLS